jgi:hypothetical protein
LVVKFLSRLSRKLGVFDPICIGSFVLIFDHKSAMKVCRWNSDTPCIFYLPSGRKSRLYVEETVEVAFFCNRT